MRRGIERGKLEVMGQAMSDVAPRIILQSELATLAYHVRDKIVHHTLHQAIWGEAFRQVLLGGVELMKQRGASKWLSDDRGNGALHPDDGKWAMEVWSPQALEAGWKYWAIVMPDASLGKANMRRFIRDYADRGVTVAIFPSPEKALAWLRNPVAATG